MYEKASLFLSHFFPTRLQFTENTTFCYWNIVSKDSQQNQYSNYLRKAKNLSIKLLLSLPPVSLNTSVAKKKQRNKQKLYHDCLHSGTNKKITKAHKTSLENLSLVFKYVLPDRQHHHSNSSLGLVKRFAWSLSKSSYQYGWDAGGVELYDVRNEYLGDNSYKTSRATVSYTTWPLTFPRPKFKFFALKTVFKVWQNY